MQFQLNSRAIANRSGQQDLVRHLLSVIAMLPRGITLTVSTVRRGSNSDDGGDYYFLGKDLVTGELQVRAEFGRQPTIDEFWQLVGRMPITTIDIGNGSQYVNLYEHHPSAQKRRRSNNVMSAPQQRARWI